MKKLQYPVQNPKSIVHLRVDVLGVGISTVNMDSTIATIDRWIENREKHYVCLCTVNGVMECHRNPGLKAIFNKSGMTTPDGMPLVFLSRLAGYDSVRRVYGPDLMLALCAHSEQRKYRHYFYGGEEGVADTLVRRLKSKFPALNVCGIHTPPFRPLTAEEDFSIVKSINRARPDIIWVGLSTPKQERWMAEHIDRLNASVLIGVGAAFDFHAGRKRQAPRWVQRGGLEWLFRLVTEPRRLGYRYLVYNPWFIYLIIARKLGLR